MTLTRPPQLFHDHPIPCETGPCIAVDRFGMALLQKVRDQLTVDFNGHFGPAINSMRPQRQTITSSTRSAAATTEDESSVFNARLAL